MWNSRISPVKQPPGGPDPALGASRVQHGSPRCCPDLGQGGRASAIMEGLGAGNDLGW